MGSVKPFKGFTSLRLAILLASVKINQYDSDAARPRSYRRGKAAEVQVVFGWRDARERQEIDTGKDDGFGT